MNRIIHAEEIISLIRTIVSELHDWRNDGYVNRGRKYELYRVKCYLEDIYGDLPKYSGEEQWEQERVMELLKRR